MLTTVTWRMAADISMWYAPSGVHVHACQTRSPFSAYPIQRPGALVRRAAADLTRAPRAWPLARPPTVQTGSEKRIAVTCVARCALSADRCRDRRRGEFTSPRPTACWPCWVEPNQWNGRTAVRLLFLLVRRVRRSRFGRARGRLGFVPRLSPGRSERACVCVLSAYLTMNLN